MDTHEMRKFIAETLLRNKRREFAECEHTFGYMLNPLSDEDDPGTRYFSEAVARHNAQYYADKMGGTVYVRCAKCFVNLQTIHPGAPRMKEWSRR